MRRYVYKRYAWSIHIKVTLPSVDELVITFLHKIDFALDISLIIHWCINSLQFGISQHLLDKLQRVQNAASRLIHGYKRHESISPGIKKLHWLPVCYRIRFKIATITFQVLSTNEPGYLCNLLYIQPPTRTCRSN